MIWGPKNISSYNIMQKRLRWGNKEDVFKYLKNYCVEEEFSLFLRCTT